MELLWWKGGRSCYLMRKCKGQSLLLFQALWPRTAHGLSLRILTACNVVKRQDQFLFCR